MIEPLSPQPGVLMFGGSFNPIHHVHLRMAYDVAKALHLKEVLLVPNFKAPHKEENFQLLPTERFEIAFEEIEHFHLDHPPPPFLCVSQMELIQKRPVFTVETLTQIAKIEAHRFLLIGLDQFESFHTWKEYRTVLELAQLCVMQRPGFSLPSNVSFLRTEGAHEKVYLFEDTCEVLVFTYTYDPRSSSAIRKLAQMGEWNHPWLSTYTAKTRDILKKRFHH